MFRRWMAATLVSATLVAAATAAPPSQPPAPIYTRQMAFTIPFQVSTSAQPGQEPTEIQLHTSSDRGRKWTMVRTAAPTARSFAVRAPGDGEYWFCVRTKDTAGNVRPAGEPTPDLRVVVDTTTPDPKLTAWRGGAGELNAQWEIRDANLDAATLQLDYRVGEGPWQEIAFERLPPGTVRDNYVGMTTWLPVERAEAYEVRVRISDFAGNPTVHRASTTGSQGPPAAAGTAQPGDTQSPDVATARKTPGHYIPPAIPNANAMAGPVIRPLPPLVGSPAASPQTVPRGGMPANMVPVNTQPATDWTAAGSRGVTNPYANSPSTSPGQVTLLPSVAATSDNRTQSTVDPLSAGHNGSSYTSSPSGSVDWPADAHSNQPLSRTSLSTPGGLRGSSSVQFQGGSTPGPAGSFPDTAAPSTASNVIQFQESNTGASYRPPLQAIDTAHSSTLPGSPTATPVAARSPWMVRSYTFELNYDLKQAAPQPGRADQAGRVELWGTVDNGQNWQRFAVDADGRSPVSVSVTTEGLYGFKLVAQNDQGLVEFPPARGDEPDVWLQVDVTRPNCRLVRAEQGLSPRDNELTIEWEASDSHLGTAAVTLEYARTLQGPWFPIAVDLGNSGRYVWQMPERTPGSFHLRIRVHDQAGNIGEFVTAEAVTPIRAAAGRILDVNPTSPPLRTGQRGKLYQFR